MSCQKNTLKKKSLQVLPHCVSRSVLLFTLLCCTRLAPRVKRGITQGWSITPSFSFVAFCECHNIGVVWFIIWYFPCLSAYIALV